MHGKRMLVKLCVLFKPLLGEATLYRHTAAEARRPRWMHRESDLARSPFLRPRSAHEKPRGGQGVGSHGVPRTKRRESNGTRSTSARAALYRLPLKRGGSIWWEGKMRR
jgi:hypothetical protein